MRLSRGKIAAAAAVGAATVAAGAVPAGVAVAVVAAAAATAVAAAAATKRPGQAPLQSIPGCKSALLLLQGIHQRRRHRHALTVRLALCRSARSRPMRVTNRSIFGTTRSRVWNGPAYDCQQCGACCSNQQAAPAVGYVCLTKHESKQMKRLG